MNQILVDVLCPATSKTYDFWLPKKMTVAKAVEKLCEEISAFESNPALFGETSDLALFSRNLRCALLDGDTLEGAGVRSGDRLTLV